MFEPEPETQGTSKNERVCGLCDTVAQHSDDFCYECGHSFAYKAPGATSEDDDDEHIGECPVCLTGHVRMLPDSNMQCESCGYMVRDGAPL